MNRTTYRTAYIVKKTIGTKFRNSPIPQSYHDMTSFDFLLATSPRYLLSLPWLSLAVAILYSDPLFEPSRCRLLIHTLMYGLVQPAVPWRDG